MEQKPTHPLRKNDTLELLRFALIALVIALTIRFFVAKPFIVTGASMEDTFHHNEYLIVDQVTYHFAPPRRGDVVIFRYPDDPSKFFIKRLIGLPGDTLDVKQDGVAITPAGTDESFRIEEPYLGSHGGATLSITLNEDEYFVMGDNRAASSDSRTWGALSKDHIIGRAFLRLFPVSKIDILPGEEDMSLSI